MVPLSHEQMYSLDLSALENPEANDDVLDDFIQCMTCHTGRQLDTNTAYCARTYMYASVRVRRPIVQDKERSGRVLPLPGSLDTGQSSQNSTYLPAVKLLRSLIPKPLRRLCKVDTKRKRGLWQKEGVAVCFLRVARRLSRNRPGKGKPRKRAD